MTHEQIEKAARELSEHVSKEVLSSGCWINTEHYTQVYHSAVADFLTRFKQQCEADALERAAVTLNEEVQKWPEERSVLIGKNLIRGIRSLKPKAL